jgi:squalene-hopene/tetraprenyl-beta-curcumene cyclase
VNSAASNTNPPTQVRIEPCLSPVWDTAIVPSACANPALPADHPALVKAADWIMERKSVSAAIGIHKNPADVEPSGWVFEFENKWNPDVDDTAMVLLALRSVPTIQPPTETR